MRFQGSRLRGTGQSVKGSKIPHPIRILSAIWQYGKDAQGEPAADGDVKSTATRHVFIHDSMTSTAEYLRFAENMPSALLAHLKHFTDNLALCRIELLLSCRALQTSCLAYILVSALAKNIMPRYSAEQD